MDSPHGGPHAATLHDLQQIFGDRLQAFMAHGHPDYRGSAWYRRAVDVPPGQDSWDILGPTLVE